MSEVGAMEDHESAVPRVDEKNWHTAKHLLRAYLCSKGLSSTLEERPPRQRPPALPPTATAEERAAAAAKAEKAAAEDAAFNKEDQKALGCLTLKVHPNLVPTVAACSSALEAWRVLESIFQAHSFAR